MKPTVSDILRDHTVLSMHCVDRLYINGYVPGLQTSGQLCYFLRQHLGFPIPSPAILQKIHDRFVTSVQSWARSEEVPLIKFKRRQRMDNVAAGFRKHFELDSGLVFIGIAQERCCSFMATKRALASGAVHFDFHPHNAFVNHYYFHVQDPEWGPAFIKIGSFAPYPVKLCLNGHEWVKRQLRKHSIDFESLDNGFLSCQEPDILQQVADSLGPDDVQDFFERWSQLLPWPLTTEDRAAGFHHELSIWQMEVSHTQVFERPIYGRHLFEQLIRDNIDLGRPDRVSLLFPTRFNRRTPPPYRGYRTRVITRRVSPSLHVEYKKSHVKQYFKEKNALRTETTINNPKDFNVGKSLKNFEQLRNIGDEINRKLQESQHISEHCSLSQSDLDALQQPTIHENQRAPALRFGDTRVMALLQALCLYMLLPWGFRNVQLRTQVANLMGVAPEQYRANQMTYDLRRLRQKGLIERIPKSYRYQLTPLGLRVAYFHSKVFAWLLRPAWAAFPTASYQDEIPRPLGKTFNQLDVEIEKLFQRAKLERQPLDKRQRKGDQILLQM